VGILLAIPGYQAGFHPAADPKRNLKIDGPQRTDKKETRGNCVQLPAGAVIKPPVGMQDLKADTEYDPEGAEEFVALIRALRSEGSHPVTI
jgi:hypothetical protein